MNKMKKYLIKMLPFLAFLVLSLNSSIIHAVPLSEGTNYLNVENTGDGVEVVYYLKGEVCGIGCLPGVKLKNEIGIGEVNSVEIVNIGSETSFYTVAYNDKINFFLSETAQLSSTHQPDIGKTIDPTKEVRLIGKNLVAYMQIGVGDPIKIDSNVFTFPSGAKIKIAAVKVDNPDLPPPPNPEDLDQVALGEIDYGNVRLSCMPGPENVNKAITDCHGYPDDTNIATIKYLVGDNTETATVDLRHFYYYQFIPQDNNSPFVKVTRTSDDTCVVASKDGQILKNVYVKQLTSSSSWDNSKEISSYSNVSEVEFAFLDGDCGFNLTEQGNEFVSIGLDKTQNLYQNGGVKFLVTGPPGKGGLELSLKRPEDQEGFGIDGKVSNPDGGGGTNPEADGVNGNAAGGGCSLSMGTHPMTYLWLPLLILPLIIRKRH